MHSDKNAHSFSLLFFPEPSQTTFTMYLSTPPPKWLDSEDMTKIIIGETGVYCLFFLVCSAPGGRAYITVNNREIRGSYAEEKNGRISGSAVCSIRELALPCSFSIKSEAGAEGGVLLVFKYPV